MPYNPAIHNRHSIRLPGYDYSQTGAYYLTILTYKKEHLFGKVVDGTVQRSPVGEIVHEQWLKIPRNFSNVVLDAFVIMPNHIRRNGILVITGGEVRSGKGKAFSPDFAKSGENALPLHPQLHLQNKKNQSYDRLSVCPRRDSNPQPTDSKSGTLSIELRGHFVPRLYRNALFLAINRNCAHYRAQFLCSVTEKGMFRD